MTSSLPVAAGPAFWSSPAGALAMPTSSLISLASLTVMGHFQQGFESQQDHELLNPLGVSVNLP